jgi:hypothetical protein
MRVVIAVTCLVASAAAASAQSIVGRWSAQANCAADSVTTIGAKSLKNADVDCRFATVQRAGTTVTWRGMCDGAEGRTKQTVVATLKGDRLSYRYVPGGNWVDGLKRCR